MAKVSLVNEGDVHQGDEVSFLTGATDPESVLRVEVHDNDGNPLWETTVGAYPDRTPVFNLGPGPLWPESARGDGGKGTATLWVGDKEKSKAEFVVVG